MAEVIVRVGGRAYGIHCAPGEEEHVAALAAAVDARAGRLAGELGQLGEARLLLTAALTLADDLAEANAALARAADRAEAIARSLEPDPRAP